MPVWPVRLANTVMVLVERRQWTIVVAPNVVISHLLPDSA